MMKPGAGSKARATGRGERFHADFALGEYTISPASGRVSGPAGFSRLEPRVMDLLVYLAERSGEVVARVDVIDHVWSGSIVTDDVLSRAVYQIRKALTTASGDIPLIETVPKRGYRCMLPMVPLVAETGISRARVLRLAVLPFFEQVTGVADPALTDGLHAEILSTLAQRAAGLEVISRTSVMRFRSPGTWTLPDLTASLGATHVLEGSVRHDGPNLHVMMLLTDVAHDRHIWSRDYDRATNSAMTLQTDIADDVATQLRISLVATGASSTVAQTQDFEAYEFFLRGKLARQILNPGRPRGRFTEVEALFSAAIARDPAFVMAYVERLRVRAWLVEWNYDTSPAQRRAAADDLKALGGLLGDDHPLLATMEGVYWSEVEYDPDRALEIYSRPSVATQADSYFLMSKARLLLRMRRVAEATELMRVAAAHTPGNAVLLNVSSLLHLAAWDPIEAIRLSTAAVAAGAIALARIYARFSFTGDTTGLREFLRHDGTALEDDYRLQLTFRCALFDRRYTELRDLLARVPATTLRIGISHIGLMAAGLGRRPVAEMLGWVHLLLGESLAARDAGRAVLEFAATADPIASASWYLTLLQAQGALFAGDTVVAATRAQQAVAQATANNDVIAYVEAAYIAACVLAWAGAKDAALSLLEQLMGAVPTLGPAFVVASPMCTVPLTSHTGFQRLAARLATETADIARQF